MKRLFLLALVTSSTTVSAQNVGINTHAPVSTLQVVGNPSSTSTADGVTVPSLSGNQLKAKDEVYTSAQTGTVVYVTAAVGTTSAKTINVKGAGFYYFDGAVWHQTVNTSGNISAPNGWVRGLSRGQLLNSVFVTGASGTVISSSSTWQTVISYSYTPVHNDSKIMVQYHNNSYYIGGTAGSGRDEYQSRVSVNGSVITVNEHAASLSSDPNTQFRTATVFPIVAVVTNGGTSAISILVQVRRSAGDDGFTLPLTNGSFIIQEIAD